MGERCNMTKLTKWITLISILVLVPAASTQAGPDVKHFHPRGKLPSKYTVEKQQALRKSLPFEDKRDYEEQKKGFIAAPSYKQIKKDDGTVIWDMGAFEFLLQGQDFDSIHPSLQRQAILNMNYGLYEVIPDRIYQIRGFDLANITFIKGDTGWIIFDPLTARETAKAALDFINEKLGKLPVVAVVYSHSHADHFGGVRGVVDETDVKAGKVKILAPRDFLDHAVSENVCAGVAMTRRVQYQYANMLPKSPYGHVDSAIGKGVAGGNIGLIQPTDVIEGDFEERTIDGVKMVFQNTPGTEAPSEMNTYFPDLKTFWGAENIVHSVHNIYTLRGALVRDPLRWYKHINAALYRFGPGAKVLISSHNWPRWGNERVKEVMRAQRDAYANLNNQVLHLANQGVTINEIHNVYQVPKSLQQQWVVRQYHGSEFHNSRAVVNRYLGYWDANPATLAPLSPKDSAPLYVEMMGGAKSILAKGQELYNQGKYRQAMEIVNKLVQAQPQNQPAKDLLADIFEQLGYQYESTSMRNVHLAAANELRSGIAKGGAFKSAGPDVVRAMTTEQWLDAIGIRVDSGKADGMAFTINFVTPDNNEKYIVEMSGGTLTNIKGYKAEKPDLTVSIDRSDLEEVMMGKVTFDEQIKNGKAKLEGDHKVYTQLKSTLVQFDPLFEIMPGTKQVAGEKDDDPFEQDVYYTGE
jgi:alkyl sulfatase BDS1-like metallo-beta-lactamase superfamily hydrolase